MRIVVIGDIGVDDGMLHVGDEAMFEELVVQLRARGVDRVTAISSNPAETAKRYGVDAIPGAGFASAGGREAMADRMGRVIRTAGGAARLLAADDPASRVIEAVRRCDGVAIAGGGNLSSLWPSHVFERATLGEIARVLGKPLIVSGQTIGPYLNGPDRMLVAGLLSSARAVGLRERASLELSRQLGVSETTLALTVDDASFLPERYPDSTSAAKPYCLVTLARHVGGHDQNAFHGAVAGLLDELAANTGLALLFCAHFGSTTGGPPRGDELVHEQVRARMTVPSEVVATLDSGSAARLSGEASFVVTSRYHPAVFAVSGGVPTVAIAVDDYTTTKLGGALENFGQTGLLQIDELSAGRGPSLASALWAERAVIRDRGLAIAAARRDESALWWDRLALELSGDR